MFFKSYENNKTRSRYTNNYYQYIAYCRSEFNCQTKDDCSDHVQEYEQYLESQGYSASTIHNRLVPVCLFLDIPLETIAKPKRITSMYTRGRTGNRTIESNCDINNPIYKRTVDFQKCVGIRRNELKHLRGDDLITDESGYLCVRVRKGKGGKMQLQRILPEDMEFISSYFKDKKTMKLYSSPKKYPQIMSHIIRSEPNKLKGLISIIMNSYMENMEKNIGKILLRKYKQEPKNID